MKAAAPPTPSPATGVCAQCGAPATKQCGGCKRYNVQTYYCCQVRSRSTYPVSVSSLSTHSTSTTLSCGACVIPVHNRLKALSAISDWSRQSW